jgi:catechol 2,3-dioxygenase-like lactoylglutathione lyase family enzyme
MSDRLTEGPMNIFCHHFGILARNPNELKEFYIKCLGFEEGKTRLLPADLVDQIFSIPSPCYLTKLRRGSLVLEVFSLTDLQTHKRESATVGYNHWGMGVEDKEQFVHDLKQKSVPVLEIEHSGRMIYFLKDPEGNLIEIYEVKG